MEEVYNKFDLVLRNVGLLRKPSVSLLFIYLFFLFFELCICQLYFDVNYSMETLTEIHTIYRIYITGVVLYCVYKTST